MLKTLVPAVIAGVVAALLSFFSTLALVIAALTLIGADARSLASALTASCAAIALLGGGLTWRWRMPVLISWSVPGAALLAGLSGLESFGLAVGGFVASALLMLGSASWPPFIRWVERLPSGLSAALLASLLFPFTLGAVQAFEHSLLLGGVSLMAYLLGRRLAPAYAVVFVLLALVTTCLLTLSEGAAAANGFTAGLIWHWPSLSLNLILSLGLPLWVVSLVAQNLPGLALLRQQGHQPSVRKVLWITGGASLLLAPMGVFGLNLAPISAAMCSGAEGEGAEVRRVRASLAYAATYAGLALCSAQLLQAFNALPRAAILALTGFALLVPLCRSLERMLLEEHHREAAVMTFLTGASGVTLAGIGSTFWALAVGLLAIWVI